MNTIQIKRLLEHVDESIAEEVLSLVAEINRELNITRIAYNKKKRDYLVLKNGNKHDDSQLINKALNRLSMHPKTHIYFDPVAHVFNFRIKRKTDTFGKELVGYYEAPYDRERIKEDMECTLNEMKS